MAEQSAYYFGFGSLVNRNTRPTGEEAWNASLKGWQRVWDHRVMNTDNRLACTSLSIEPADKVIQGVLVKIRASELQELDVRESGYERMSLDASQFELPENIHTTTVYVYRSLQENRNLANDQHPILQSYVDCVMAGYSDRFGRVGLERMLDSTRGWDQTIANDRLNPLYPRHVALPEEHRDYFDSLLVSLR